LSLFMILLSTQAIEMLTKTLKNLKMYFKHAMIGLKNFTLSSIREISWVYAHQQIQAWQTKQEAEKESKEAYFASC
jgi:hypothetical protein